jgi:Protein of unknown function (DUF1566)
MLHRGSLLGLISAVVLCVGCATPIASRFQPLGDGSTVKDSQTGLVWMRCDVGLAWKNGNCVNASNAASSRESFDAESAKAFIKKFNAAGGYAGYSKWRLPEISELQALRSCVGGTWKKEMPNLTAVQRTQGVSVAPVVVTQDIPAMNGGSISVPKSCNVGAQAHINQNAFPNTMGGFWTNTQNSESLSGFWVVHFGFGSLEDQYANKRSKYALKLVQ